MRIPALAIALMLGGCTTTTYKVDVTADKVPFDKTVAQQCDPVPATPPRGSSFGTVYEFGNKMVGLYGECALRDKAKADWIKSQGH